MAKTMVEKERQIEDAELSFLPRLAGAFATLIWLALVAVAFKNTFEASSWSSIANWLGICFFSASAGVIALWVFVTSVLCFNLLSKQRRVQFRDRIVNWSWLFALLTAWVLLSFVLEELGD